MFIAIISSIYELASFNTWLMNNKYNAMCNDLEADLSESCSTMKLSVEPGTWFALLGAVSLWIASTYSIYYTESSNQDAQRNNQEYQSISQRGDDEDSYQSVSNNRNFNKV